MFTLLGAVALAAVFIGYFSTLKSRDTKKIQDALVNEPGEIAELKLVSMSPVVMRRGSGPRIYRVVLKIPNGGRLLHRFAVRDFGPAERLI